MLVLRVLLFGITCTQYELQYYNTVVCLIVKNYGHYSWEYRGIPITSRFKGTKQKGRDENLAFTYELFDALGNMLNNMPAIFVLTIKR